MTREDRKLAFSKWKEKNNISFETWSDGNVFKNDVTGEKLDISEDDLKVAHSEALIDEENRKKTRSKSRELGAPIKWLESLFLDIEAGKLDKTGIFYTKYKEIYDKYK